MLFDYDIVITTYSTLSTEYKRRFKPTHRIAGYDEDNSDEEVP